MKTAKEGTNRRRLDIHHFLSFGIFFFLHFCKKNTFVESAVVVMQKFCWDFICVMWVFYFKPSVKDQKANDDH